MTKLYFSFDVESRGLFGSPFAVGWVLVNRDGEELASGYLACPVVLKSPQDDWLIENVVPALPREPDGSVLANCGSRYEMFQRFWTAWTKAKQQYPDVVMVTDCPWPVESGFLHQVQRQIGFGMEDSPYPILDAATVLAAGGYDPLATLPRLSNEEPAHHPVHDARQSVRIMLETMREIAADKSYAIVHSRYVMDSNATLTYTEAVDGFGAITVRTEEPHE